MTETYGTNLWWCGRTLIKEGDVVNVARPGRFEPAVFIRRNEASTIVWHKYLETGLIGCSKAEMVSVP